VSSKKKVHRGIAKKALNHRPASKGIEEAETTLRRSQKKINYKMTPQITQSSRLNEKEAVRLCKLDQRKKRGLQNMIRRKGRSQGSHGNAGAHHYEI
jgi:hypothetical protein